MTFENSETSEEDRLFEALRAAKSDEEKEAARSALLNFNKQKKEKETLFVPPVDDYDPTIASRPIEAGVYGWGWVDYGQYNGKSQPDLISVVLLDDVISRRDVKLLMKFDNRPRWRNILAVYGPLIVGVLLMFFGNVWENNWLGKIAFGLALLSGYYLWRLSRLSDHKRTTIVASSSIENYPVGKDFLRALHAKGLKNDEIHAFFELKYQANEVKKFVEENS